MASVANENGKLAKARAAVGDDYVPDDTEEYMNKRQQQYFRVLLLEWKDKVPEYSACPTQQLEAFALLGKPSVLDPACHGLELPKWAQPGEEEDRR